MGRANGIAARGKSPCACTCKNGTVRDWQRDFVWLTRYDARRIIFQDFLEGPTTHERAPLHTAGDLPCTFDDSTVPIIHTRGVLSDTGAHLTVTLA